MRLFLDTSVLLAGSGSARGASRELFRLAPRNGWTLVATPYMWVGNDFLFPGKQAQVEAHERGHAAISERWFDQVVADARTMESYQFCSEDECQRKATRFEYAWKWKLRLRQFFYETFN